MNAPSKLATIYILCDGRESDPIARVRYVGRTIHPLERRMRAHRQTALAGERTARASWMRSVILAGGDVLIEPVDFINRDACGEAERRWIAHYKALGAKLMNLTDGGDGLLNPDASIRVKIGAAKRGNKFWVGRKHTAESKAKMATARIGTAMHQNTRAALYTSEVRQKQAATIRARILTPEEIDRKRCTMLATMRNPVVREKHRQSLNTPEHRAYLSARQSSPEAIERMRAIGKNSRGRKMSDAFRVACRARQLGRKHTDLTKQKMSTWQRGGDSHRSKLTWEQVCAIRARYELGGISQHQLARDYTVQPRTINLIVHYKTWIVEQVGA